MKMRKHEESWAFQMREPNASTGFLYDSQRRSCNCNSNFFFSLLVFFVVITFQSAFICVHLRFPSPFSCQI